MSKQNLITYTALIVSMLFWGFSFIWSKMVFEVYKPVTTVCFRLIISSIFLWIVGILLKKIEKLQKKDFSILALMTFYQPFLYFLGENYGLNEVSSTIASVLIATIPLFSPFAAYFFLKERLSPMNFTGILISIVGVVMVVLKDDLSLAASPKGLFFLGLAVASAIAYSVVIVKLTGKYNIYSLITYQNTLGVFMFLPLFFFLDWHDFLASQITTKAFTSLIFLSIFASSFAFMLFTYGIQKIGITRANSFSNIIPVFTAFFAWILLDEQLNSLNIIGIALVVGGLFLSQIKYKPKFYSLRFRK